MKTLLKIICIILATLGLMVSGFIIFNNAYFNTSCVIETQLAADFGSFFGGFVGTIFSLVSILVIVYTIVKQNTENRKSAVTNNFFKMIDYHNAKVQELNISHIKKSRRSEKIKGQRAFVIFKMQIKGLIELIEDVNKESHYNLSDKQIADIAYMVFHYGIDEDGVNFARKHLNILHPQCHQCPQHKELAKRISTKIKGNLKLKLDRINQTSLSSYFRNMYNAIKLVDEDTILSKTEKKELIKIYRAQLSDPELYVLFFSLISRFGKKWKEKKFITKYEFIKNIPQGYCDPYNPKDHFPMKFEFEELNEEESEINR